MKTFAALFCALLLAGPVSAQGVYNMAKQQARKAVASEERNQQAIGSSGQSPSAPPAQNNNPQNNPELQATLQNNSNLRADFDDLGAGRTNTLALQNDLTTAAQGAKPAAADVTRLAGDLAAVIAANKNLPAQQPKLAQYVHALFNGSHLSAAQQETVLDAVQKILSDGGVATDDATKLVADLKTIAVETR